MDNEKSKCFTDYPDGDDANPRSVRVHPFAVEDSVDDEEEAIDSDQGDGKDGSQSAGDD